MLRRLLSANKYCCGAKNTCIAWRKNNTALRTLSHASRGNAAQIATLRKAGKHYLPLKTHLLLSYCPLLIGLLKRLVWRLPSFEPAWELLQRRWTRELCYFLYILFSFSFTPFY